MIVPTQLLPHALGLQWGMAKDECLRVLNVVALEEGATYATLDLTIQGCLVKVHLLFDEAGGLTRIAADLHVSRSFWDNCTPEEVDALYEQYRGLYACAVARASCVMGRPAYSGSRNSPGFPEDEMALELSYWDTPQGRAQIEFLWPEKDFPFYVRAVSYQADE